MSNPSLRVTITVAEAKLDKYNNSKVKAVSDIEKNGLTLQEAYYSVNEDGSRAIFHLWTIPEDSSLYDLMEKMGNLDGGVSDIVNISMQKHHLVAPFCLGNEYSAEHITRNDLVKGNKYFLLSSTYQAGSGIPFKEDIRTMQLTLYKSGWSIDSACQCLTGSLGTTHLLWRIPDGKDGELDTTQLSQSNLVTAPKKILVTPYNPKNPEDLVQ